MATKPARPVNGQYAYYQTNMPAPSGAPALQPGQIAQRSAGYYDPVKGTVVRWDQPQYIVKDTNGDRTYNSPGDGLPVTWRSGQAPPNKPNTPIGTPKPGGSNPSNPSNPNNPNTPSNPTTPTPTTPTRPGDGLYDWQRNGFTPEFGAYLNSKGVVDLAAWNAARLAGLTQQGIAPSLAAAVMPDAGSIVPQGAFADYLRTQGIR